MTTIEYNFHGMHLRGVRYGQGKPILALHGWLDNAASFSRLAPLIANGYSVDCWELMGHGHSDHLPHFAHYHFIDAIPRISGILQEFYERQPCIILGHSLGGAIASVMASLVPEQITHCIAIEGFGPITSPVEETWEQMHAYLRCQFEFHHSRHYESLEQAAQVRSKKTPIRFEDALLLCQRGMAKSEQGYMWSHDRRLVDPSPLKLTEPQVKAILEKISIPFCFIQADDGFRPDMLKMRYEYLQCPKEHHVLEGRHHIHMEQAEQIATIIKEFTQSS